MLPLRATKSSGGELARVAKSAARDLGIEPGTLALIFGYSTGDWQTANVALNAIYSSRKPVWRDINAIAERELLLQDIPSDAINFLYAVLGRRTA